MKLIVDGVEKTFHYNDPTDLKEYSKHYTIQYRNRNREKVNTYHRDYVRNRVATDEAYVERKNANARRRYQNLPLEKKEEVRKQQRQRSIKKYHEDEEYRKKHLEGQKEKYNNNEAHRFRQLIRYRMRKNKDLKFDKPLKDMTLEELKELMETTRKKKENNWVYR